MAEYRCLDQKENNLKIFICLLIIIALFIGQCNKKESNFSRLKIVVSILPLAEFAEQIGGERVAVTVMVGPGASPHSYEPTPQQLRQISEADIYIKLGAPIEFELMMLDKLIALNPAMIVINAGAGVKLRALSGHDHDNGHEHKIGVDPHIWLSVRNARLMIGNIFQELCRIDAPHKNYYADNYQKYLDALDQLDRELALALANKQNRRFMVYHPSWGYFCNEYALEQIAVEIEGKEPSAQNIKELIEQAKNEKIRIIFASPQFNPKGAEIIARDINGQVVLIDPLAKDYINNMKSISQTLAAAME